MRKIKSIFRNTYKKNITLLKWLFTIAIVMGLVVLPILSAFVAL